MQREVYSSAIIVELLTVFVYITCSADVVIRVLQTSEHAHFELLLCVFCGWHTECRSVRCQTSVAANMNTSYEAGNRDGADLNCKIFGDNFCFHHQGMIRKDAVGLRYFGRGCDAADG